MKTLKDIKKITESSLKEQERKDKERQKKAEIKAEKDRLAEIKCAKETAIKWFPEWIVEAAQKGKRSYDIDLGMYNADGKLSTRTKLEKRYIKKYLKEFNPVFKKERRVGDNLAEIMNSEGHIGDKPRSWTYYVESVSLSW